jgi:hypothetical protein
LDHKKPPGPAGPPGTPWATLGYAEKVRSQFLSLRQLGRGHVFSALNCRRISPVTERFLVRAPYSEWVAPADYSPKGHLSPKLWTPRIRYGSRNINVLNYLSAPVARRFCYRYPERRDHPNPLIGLPGRGPGMNLERHCGPRRKARHGPAMNNYWGSARSTLS